MSVRPSLDDYAFRSGVLTKALEWSGSAVDVAIKLLAQGKAADAKAALEASLAETKGYLRQIEQADAKREARLTRALTVVGSESHV